MKISNVGILLSLFVSIIIGGISYYQKVNMQVFSVRIAVVILSFYILGWILEFIYQVWIKPINVEATNENKIDA